MNSRIARLTAVLIITVLFTAALSAEDPGAAKIVIYSEPVSAAGFSGDNIHISVGAESRTGSGLSYQWFFKVTNSSDGAVLQDAGLTDDSEGFGNTGTSELTVAVTDGMLEPGRKYYVYCYISDMDRNVVRSQKAEITALVPEDFAFSVSCRLSAASEINIGDELIITASASLGADKLGLLSYRWFAADDAGLSGVKLLDGENKPYLSVPANAEGITYYYCEITNQIYNRRFVSSCKDKPVAVTVAAHKEASASLLPFGDVSTSDWYYTDLVRAYKSGIINGKSTSEFCPDDNMTVAETVKIACCIHQLEFGSPLTASNASRPTAQWYTAYMDYALANGFITADLVPKAEETVTRGLCADILSRALPKDTELINTVRDDAFSDIDASSRWYGGVMTLLRAGIVNGYTDGSFRPASSLKRCEAAAIVARIIDKSVRVLHS